MTGARTIFCRRQGVEQLRGAPLVLQKATEDGASAPSTYHCGKLLAGCPPAMGCDETDRIIGRKPIFKLAEVQKIGRSDLMLPRTSQETVLELGWDAEDVWNAVNSLCANHFIQAEWCLSGKLWFACDAYCMRNYDDMRAPRDLVDVYLKFSVIDVSRKLLMVRCHRSTK